MSSAYGRQIQFGLCSVCSPIIFVIGFDDEVIKLMVERKNLAGGFPKRAFFCRDQYTPRCDLVENVM